jgi:hypothetical protein
MIESFYYYVEPLEIARGFPGVTNFTSSSLMALSIQSVEIKNKHLREKIKRSFSAVIFVLL